MSDASYLKRVQQIDNSIKRLMLAIKATQERLMTYGLSAEQLFAKPNNLKNLFIHAKNVFNADEDEKFEYFLPQEINKKILALTINDQPAMELTKDEFEKTKTLAAAQQSKLASELYSLCEFLKLILVFFIPKNLNNELFEEHCDTLGSALETALKEQDADKVLQIFSQAFPWNELKDKLGLRHNWKEEINDLMEHVAQLADHDQLAKTRNRSRNSTKDSK